MGTQNTHTPLYFCLGNKDCIPRSWATDVPHLLESARISILIEQRFIEKRQPHILGIAHNNGHEFFCASKCKIREQFAKEFKEVYAFQYTGRQVNAGIDYDIRQMLRDEKHL